MRTWKKRVAWEVFVTVLRALGAIGAGLILLYFWGR